MIRCRGALLSPPLDRTDRPSLCLVKGSASSLLFDAGNSSRHAREVLASLEREGAGGPDIILVSHGHCDHWFGLGEFDAVSACSGKTMEATLAKAALDWSSAGVRRRVELGDEHEMTMTMLEEEYGEREATIDLRTPDLAFDVRLRIELGGCGCLAECLGGSHDEGSTVLFVERDGLLLLGDILYARDRGEEAVDALFRKLYSYGADVFVDSHAALVMTAADMERRRADIIAGRA